MESRLCREKQLPIVDANATVVVNIFTLEVAVEDISTEGEAKGLKTAHETLLDKVGWTRPYCFGGAVQKGKFRPVSGFLIGLREGYKAVSEPGYAGQLTAHETLAADTASEGLEAFKKFTKENAETLEYLCSSKGGMEDPIANQQMLQKVLAFKEQHFGEHHWRVALTLDNLANAHWKLGDHITEKDLLDRALKFFQEHFGEDHFAVAKTLVTVGNAYHHLGEYEKADDFWERSRLIAKTWGTWATCLVTMTRPRTSSNEC